MEPGQVDLVIDEPAQGVLETAGLERLVEVDLLRTHHFRSSEELEQTLHRYVTLYNHHLPQKALNARTPVQALS